MAEKAVEKLGDVDAIFHAGDLAADARRLEETYKIKVYSVSGNCDANSPEPGEKVLEVGGKKILLTHGHLYGVKFGYERLYSRAKNISADVVVFGHTHRPENACYQDILFFNPGSTSLPRGGAGTYGILEIENGVVRARINVINSP
jgi:hypothetical protein